jgi:hypothetical protein
MPDEIQTNDELTDKIDAAIAAEPDAPQEPQTPPEPQPEPTVNPDEPAEPQEPATEPAPQEPVQPDYKEKFVNSQREAILLAERNKVKEAQLEQLTKADNPTDDAMRQLYSDWDDLNEITKKALIRQEAQEIRQRRIEAQHAEILERINKADELKAVIDSNPKLQGKEAEFKQFALNPKNKGIDAEVLAKAFLFDVEEDVPPQQVQKTEVLPQGSGGSREPLKPKKISLEEAAQIRKTDNNRYMELVKAGMIDDDID